MALTITPELLNEFETQLESEPGTMVAMNASLKVDPLELCVRRSRLMDTNHVFNHKVESEAKPMTNQKGSGRCWIFACMNVMRLPFIKHFNIEEFEFSQAYLFYWDKIERCNYFLNKMVECARKGEEVEGRLISFLLNDPTCDGGQWDMLVNLIKRYGVMPKKCFPESFSTESSGRMNTVLKSKLREYTREIHSLVSKGADDIVLTETLQRQIGEIHRIVSICLGIPPHTFTWEFYDKGKAYHKIGPITPVEFYEQHVKPLYNVEDKVCLVTDPRPKNPYGKAYTVDCLGNMVGGRQTVYNNQPVETLMSYAAESIKGGEAIWFGCDVGKRFAGKLGIQDVEFHDYKSVFGVEVGIGLSKADRLLFGESLMTHAMVFTAVSINDNGDPTKWRVENSWGEDRGEKGYLVMSTSWFKEFVFEVVVDRKHVSDQVMEVYKQEPVVLPAWDPMGALARESLCLSLQ